jgi:hypothetical protein
VCAACLRSGAAAKTAADPSAKVTSFFFSSVSGAVYYGDDLGNSSDLDLNLASAVDVLEYNLDADRLVIITRALLLTQVQVCVCVFVCVCACCVCMCASNAYMYVHAFAHGNVTSCTHACVYLCMHVMNELHALVCICVLHCTSLRYR